MKEWWLVALGTAIVVLGWWSYQDPDVVTKARAFFGETFSDSRTTAAVLSAFFAFAALVVQFWVGAKQANIGSHQANASRISADAAMLMAQSSGNRAIASMRIKWVEELRKVLSEYHSILMSHENFTDLNLKRQLVDLGTQLDLMMNMNEPDQKALWGLADKIYMTEDLEERKKLDPALMAAGRLVLKNEWEKIKRELRGEYTDWPPLSGPGGMF